MIRQNVNIVQFNSLYVILEEIKENLPFSIKKYENISDFVKEKNQVLKNSLIITNSDIKNLNQKNLFIFNSFPVTLQKLIELINVKLIKLNFDSQSKINIKGYELNLNSKFFFKKGINLKLTEKEIEIILFLNNNKTQHKVLDLQKNIWGYKSDLETHTVETHIYRLRKKISEKFNDNDFIVSQNEGYIIE